MTTERPVLKAAWWHRFVMPWRSKVIGSDDHGTALVEVSPRYWHPVYWWYALMVLLGRGPEFIEMEAEGER